MSFCFLNPPGGKTSVTVNLHVATYEESDDGLDRVYLVDANGQRVHERVGRSADAALDDGHEGPVMRDTVLVYLGGPSRVGPPPGRVRLCGRQDAMAHGALVEVVPYDDVMARLVIDEPSATDELGVALRDIHSYDLAAVQRLLKVALAMVLPPFSVMVASISQISNLTSSFISKPL